VDELEQRNRQFLSEKGPRKKGTFNLGTEKTPCTRSKALKKEGKQIFMSMKGKSKLLEFQQGKRVTARRCRIAEKKKNEGGLEEKKTKKMKNQSTRG